MNNAPIRGFRLGIERIDRVEKELYRKLPHESLIYYGDRKKLSVRRQKPRRGDRLCRSGRQAADRPRRQTDRRRLQRRDGDGDRSPEAELRAAAGRARTGRKSRRRRWHRAAGDRNSGDGGDAERPSVPRNVATLCRPGENLTQVGEGFVELVESNREQTPEALARVNKLLRPMLDAGADQSLGCTHYPFLAAHAPGNRGTAGQPGESGGGDRTAGRGPAARWLQAEPELPSTIMTSADETYRQRLIAKASRYGR